MMRKLAIGGLLLALGACVAASPAYADDRPNAPRCTPNLATMAENLAHIYGEVPLVGVYQGKDADSINYMASIFYNAEAGTWTLTQSNNIETCVVTGTTPGKGGVLFDFDAFIKPRKIGTES